MKVQTNTHQNKHNVSHLKNTASLYPISCETFPLTARDFFLLIF
jgi:hypothetical protein